MKSVFCRVLVWLCVVASAAAQGQTLTTALPDNGAGGVFMNLLPEDGPLTLTGFDVPLDAGAPQGTTVTVQVWVRAGDYAGFTDSSAGWTLSQTVSGVHQGAAWTPFALSNPLTLDGGAVTAIHLHSTTAGAGLRFTGSDAQTPKTAWANSDLSLSSDTARTGAEAFGGTEEVPRAFSGTLHYTRALPTQEANNGSGGVFLDLQATGRPLLVTGFDLYLDGGPGVASSIQVWTREGSYVGATDSDAGWTLSQTIVVASAFDLPTRVNLRAPIRVMPAQPTGIYLQSTTFSSGIEYLGLAESPPQTTWTNNDLQLFSDRGVVSDVPFDPNQRTPRTFAGRVLYTKAFETALPDAGQVGVFMALQAVRTEVTLTGFEVPVSADPGTVVDIEVWTRPGSYAGFTDSSAGWTRRQTVSGITQALAPRTPFNLRTPIVVPGHQPLAVYLHSITPEVGMQYTSTSAQTPALWSNGDLVMFSDRVRTGRVPFGGDLYTGRTFSGVLRYADELLLRDGFED